MAKRVVACLVCLMLFVGVLCSGFVFAGIMVGVGEGDIVEYSVECTGDVSGEHNIRWAKIEVVDVKDKIVDINVTTRYFDDRLETMVATLNLETGEILDAFIVPANLSEGDTFLKQDVGTITVSGIEEKVYGGAERSVVIANTSDTVFCWDRPTGFLMEANSSYPDFSMHMKMEKTNVWQDLALALDSMFSIVLVALIVVLVLVILLRYRMRG